MANPDAAMDTAAHAAAPTDADTQMTPAASAASSSGGKPKKMFEGERIAVASASAYEWQRNSDPECSWMASAYASFSVHQGVRTRMRV
jgi:hypothetical protein